MIGWLATARTFLGNFAGPTTIAVLVGMAVGGPVGCTVAKRSSAKQTAKLEQALAAQRTELADYRVAVVDSAAAADRQAANRQLEAQEAHSNDLAQIFMTLRASETRTRASFQETQRVLQESLSSAQWACLSNPAPDPVRERLCRPGEDAAGTIGPPCS